MMYSLLVKNNQRILEQNATLREQLETAKKALERIAAKKHWNTSEPLEVQFGQLDAAVICAQHELAIIASEALKQIQP